MADHHYTFLICLKLRLQLQDFSSLVTRHSVQLELALVLPQYYCIICLLDTVGILHAVPVPTQQQGVYQLS